MTIQVKVRQTTTRPVQPIHRRILRRLPLWLLEEAYEQMRLGYNEHLVCSTLGVSWRVMDGVLTRALEEAMWERGCMYPGVLVRDEGTGSTISM
jgi:hypothetical protein